MSELLMPPATSGRYQSRLFNFFHQQSRRWGGQFERTIRHLQVAANWSFEALLYPVYLLIRKATESAGKQLHTNEQQPKLQLQGNETDNSETPLSADTPIQRVLEAVVTLQIGEAGEHKSRGSRGSRAEEGKGEITPSSGSSPLLPHSLPTVQGIASLLANRNLVLVTAENEILDILTPQQQEKLENRILDEVATYWHSWRLTQGKDETKLLPKIDRLLNKSVSGGQEIMPVLPQSTGNEQIEEYKKIPVFSQGLSLLDATFAQLESHTIVPISRASGQLLQAVQTQLNIFIYGKQQKLTTEQRALDADREHQISKIQALIWGAIHYFFGEHNVNKLEQKPQPILLTNPYPVLDASKHKL
ncbi:MAG: hypothetical protein HC773_23300 [Scytonema sp. CRU_2_7]|nr:hypothetical protein [Scytonema sp. CRU_2_7]